MDIEQALKDEIREAAAKLKRAQRALEEWTADKKPKNPKGTPVSKAAKKAIEAQKNGSDTEPPASPGKLPVRILELVASGPMKVKDIATKLVAPEGQVATTCSRMAKTGRLVKFESEDGMSYGVADVNPFAGQDAGSN